MEAFSNLTGISGSLDYPDHGSKLGLSSHTSIRLTSSRFTAFSAPVRPLRDISQHSKQVSMMSSEQDTAILELSYTPRP
jgi:hypothetical protein